MSNRIDDFLQRLAASVPKQKQNFTQDNATRSLEKVYLNVPTNFGRYQVFPMNDVITDSYPFVSLRGTREINMPRKFVKLDGTEEIFNRWIKILPKSAYIMKDMTGRVVSSLTAQDEQILNQAYAVWDQLWLELNAKESLDLQKTLIRRKNYTIFHAMCLNKWDPNQSRNPSKQNFCALFVSTASGFTEVIENNIQEKILMNGGDTSWIGEIYNRQTTGRSGFLMFSVNTKNGSAGFSITATHEIGNNSFSNITIPQEDADLMSDPLITFLGNQANKDDQNPVGSKRLFNQALITEAIQYMSEYLAEIRSAKALGENDLKEVIRKTSEEALSKNVYHQKPAQQTNDPMLANGGVNNTAPTEQTGVINPEAIQTKNNDPFASAPVYHADPVSGAPVDHNTNTGWGGFGAQQSAPFNPNPGFGQKQTDDLPF